MLGDRKNSLEQNGKGEYAAESTTPVAGIGYRKKLNSIVHRRISLADMQPNLQGRAHVSRTNLMETQQPNNYTMPAS